MMASLNDVTIWFQEAKPGQKISYHVGNLAFDRYVAKGASYHPSELEQKSSCCSASRFLMQQYINGNVILVQRRVERDVCEYIAVRR
jgi:hypothetical protein